LNYSRDCRRAGRGLDARANRRGVAHPVNLCPERKSHPICGHWRGGTPSYASRCSRASSAKRPCHQPRACRRQASCWIAAGVEGSRLADNDCERRDRAAGAAAAAAHEGHHHGARRGGADVLFVVSQTVLSRCLSSRSASFTQYSAILIKRSASWASGSSPAWRATWAAHLLISGASNIGIPQTAIPSRSQG
jgi:hypothetical protein